MKPLFDKLTLKLDPAETHLVLHALRIMIDERDEPRNRTAYIHLYDKIIIEVFGK